MDPINIEERKVSLDQLGYVELRHKDGLFLLYGEKDTQAYAWEAESFRLMASWPLTQPPPGFLMEYKQI